MDNDNKIKNKGENMLSTEQRHKEVLLFLNDELNRLQTSNSSSSYDLEKEYAKTKKNKSAFVFILLFSSILVVFLASWAMTAHIKKQNESITVNLQEFEGLNIKNLLDSVSKVQANYDAAVKNKTNLIADRDMELKRAEEKRDSDLFVIESLNLRKKEAEKRRQAVQEEYEETLALIEQNYGHQILIAENEVDEYKKQLDEYDTSKLEAARQQEQVLDSERRLHKLEIDKLSSDYEKRISAIYDAMAEERQSSNEKIRQAVTEVSQEYMKEIALLDPDLRNEKSIGLVNRILVIEQEPFDTDTFLSQNKSDDPEIVSAFNRFADAYKEYLAVQAPFENIPYKNNASSYVAASKKLVTEMGLSFEASSSKLYTQNKNLSAKVNELNNQITTIKKENAEEKAQMREAFNAEKAQLANDYINIYDGILASAKASAVIISAHEKENIRIYVIPGQREHITEAGVGAEIKASKSIKGIIKPIEGEPGFYRFESALDKAGNPVDFDFDLVAPGQIVKVSAK